MVMSAEIAEISFDPALFRSNGSRAKAAVASSPSPRVSFAPALPFPGPSSSFLFDLLLYFG